MKAGFRSFS